MKRQWCHLTLVVALTLAGIALAQPKPPAPGASAPPKLREMYEDVEIMRRILDRTLHGLPGVGIPGAVHSMAFSPDGKYLSTAGEIRSTAISPDGKYLLSGVDRSIRVWDTATGKLNWMHPTAGRGFAELPSLQGTYLKGHGVVYSMTLPWHYQPVVGKAGKPGPRPLTEWERLRKELRGEKGDPEKERPGENIAIADAVLKVLAENGKNFSQLPETESVTVALTLNSHQACASCHDMKKLSKEESSERSELFREALRHFEEAFDKSPETSLLRTQRALRSSALHQLGESEKALKELERALIERKDNARRHTLLGDLHQKQGKTEEAVKAYQQAVEEYQNALEMRRRGELDLKGALPARDVQTDLDLADVYTKLAQAYTALGKKDQATQSLRKLAELALRASAPDKPATPPTPSPQTLPAKLIITAPKALLDLAGAGKVTFEEFKKTATVEYHDFVPPVKPPEKP